MATPTEQQQVTLHLEALEGGDKTAVDRLLPLVA